MQRLKKPLTSCCWRIGLRAGGIAIGWFGLICGVISIFYVGIVPGVITILLESAWIYGIKKNMHWFMLPALISSFISTVFTLLVVVFGTIILLVHPSILGVHEDQVIPTIIGFWVAGALIPYFTAVRYWLYREIKGDKQTEVTTVVYNV